MRNILRRFFPARVEATAASREAEYFGNQDNARQRAVAWSAVPYYQQRLQRGLDLGAIARRHLAGREDSLALSLAPGDMSGEYAFLSRVGAQAIDAFDISPGQRDKFFARERDPEVPVNYQIADVNEIELQPERYDLIYVQQAFHHFEALEHVASAINQALKPDGLFVLIDYIGANFLQRTARQRAYCGELWRDMPARYRTTADGRVLDGLFIPEKSALSPFEAIRAEEITEILNTRLRPRESFEYAAILFPLLNGFTQNYTDSDEDQAYLRDLWDLDRQVIESGEVEPNFLRAVYAKR